MLANMAVVEVIKETLVLQGLEPNRHEEFCRRQSFAVKKILVYGRAFVGIRNIATAFTTASHFSLSQGR
jgi:hypothetical protein